MKFRKSSSKFRQLTVESLDGRDLPSATLPVADSLMSDRVIVRFLNEPVNVTVATDITSIGFGYYRVDLRAGIDTTQALQYFAARTDVAEAMPDAIVKFERTTNDPSLSSQWSLSRTGTLTAWDRFTGNGNTLVAVIDTGVDWSHGDLAANIWTNSREIAGNGRDDDGNGFADDIRGWDFANRDNNPMDDDGHGTHVAGIIGGVGNNALGISGVNMSAKILPLKFLKADGTGFTSDAVLAMNYAINNGAKIINLSWGGGSYNTALASAISTARARGIIVVAAAGNSGSNNDTTPFYPASYNSAYDNMITVGASTSTDGAASYSNYGRTAVTIYAPGSSILSLKPGNQYTTLSGTSMASPFIAGALSLLWDRNPTWTYSQVISKMRSSIDTASAFVNSQTGGRINVAKLLDAVSVPPTTTPTLPPAPTNPVGTRTLYSATAPSMAVRDFTTATMPLYIAGDWSITDIDVRVSISHAYVGDLSLRLIGPDGTSVLLSNRRGGSGDNYNSTLFSDQAATSITTAAAPFAGTFKAEGSLTAFNGRNSKGTWYLSVTDHAYYDGGTLNTFSIFVTGTTNANQRVSKQGFHDWTASNIAFDLRSETKSLLGFDTTTV